MLKKAEKALLFTWNELLLKMKVLNGKSLGYFSVAQERDNKTG
jgi:hypothetical protein